MALSKPAGSRAGSVRGGRANSNYFPIGDVAEASLQFKKEIDVVGTDDMPKRLTYPCKHGTVVELKPSGRSCRLCPLRDDGWDPVTIACKRIKVFTAWGKPPLPNGETNGRHCYYCVKFHAGRIKRSRVPHISITEYEKTLCDGGTQKLEIHRTMITLEIKEIISNGGKISLHIDWDKLETQTLRLQHKRSITKRMPGWSHYADTDYILEFGDFNTNGKQSEGHRRWTMDGKPGVLVPDKQITRIEFSDEMASFLDSEVTHRHRQTEPHTDRHSHSHSHSH